MAMKVCNRIDELPPVHAAAYPAAGADGHREGFGGFLHFPGSLIAAAALAVTSCTTPAVKTETIEVRVPVAVQPITPAQVPTPPAPLGPRPSSLSAAADALFAQVCKLEAYVLRADPLLRVSAGQKPTELPKYPECEGR
jgi:hypothetical protein